MRFFKKNKLLTVLLIIFSFYIYYNFTRIVEINNLVDKSSKHYINDLYASDGRIYENYLDSNEQKLYEEIVKNTSNYKKSFKLNYSDYQCNSNEELSFMLSKSYNAILMDHPELMNYAGIKWSWKVNSNEINVNLDFAFNNKLKEYIGILKIQREIANIKDKTKNMTDQNKIKYVYNWIGDNARYDYTFQTFSKNQSIYNVFMKGNAVCAAFSKASQIIFQNIGIESYTISGNTTGPHMWNIVKLDDKYYYYDSTVSACIEKGKIHHYDGLKQEKFKDYVQGYPEWYQDIKIEEENGLYK